MSTYLVAHTKGGVAKTTTAFNLAVMAQSRNLRALLVDCDPGQSSRKAAEIRASRDDLPFLECLTLIGDDTGKQLRAKERDYDVIIVDAGGEGQGAREIRRTLFMAKAVITPCRPDRANTARLDIMNELISNARIDNPELDAMLFPVQASTNARANDVGEFYVDALEFPEYRMLTSVVRHRAQYQQWAKTGEAIFEQKRPNKQAVEEMEALYAEVFSD